MVVVAVVGGCDLYLDIGGAGLQRISWEEQEGERGSNESCRCERENIKILG